jgi:RNA polymerase sigma-54 factor
MAIEIKQQLKLTQQLVMTPQLQQAIKLLQLSRMELVETIREELLQNPVLEDGADDGGESSKATASADSGVEGRVEEAERMGETETPLTQVQDDKLETTAEVEADTRPDGAAADFDWEGYLEGQSAAPLMPSQRPSAEVLPSSEATLSSGATLLNHLEWQLKLSRDFSPEEQTVALLIIGNVTDDGYLCETLEDVAADANVSLEVVEKVLAKVQEFDPPGVAARTLEECLLLQAKHLGADDDVVKGIINKHLPQLEKKNYLAIAKDLGQPLDEIYEATKVVMGLDPKPGRAYTGDQPRYITPDVYIHKLGNKYFVVANDDGMPKLKISEFYRKAFGKGAKAKEYVRERLRSAQWLIFSIQQRQRTIVRVTESLLRFQHEFFDQGPSHLKPLVLRDVAADIGVHESTVSRVTTNKYVHTPQGLFELKYFFDSGISRTEGDDLASEAVKLKIKAIIAAEDPHKPHSDQKIVRLLADNKIEIARRTVAKYREQLKIMPSSQRRQVF